MKVINTGILCSIQDLGRFGQMKTGVSPGGAVDKLSLKTLNILLENSIGNPAIEFHFPAPKFQFEENCQFALSGADFNPEINGKPILNGKIYEASNGDLLIFKKKISGQRCYLGFRGKMVLKNWQGSYSENLFLKHPETSDKIKIIPSERLRIKSGIYPQKLQRQIHFVPEFDYGQLTEESKASLFSEEFTILPESNRMGYRLNGSEIKLKKKLEKVSSAVNKGTVQLLPNGQLIILMADAQTTGGYPILGYVSAVSISNLAQLGAGEKIVLKSISEKEAIQQIITQNESLERLKLSLKILK